MLGSAFRSAAAVSVGPMPKQPPSLLPPPLALSSSRPEEMQAIASLLSTFIDRERRAQNLARCCVTLRHLFPSSSCYGSAFACLPPAVDQQIDPAKKVYVYFLLVTPGIALLAC
ncbi:hypothetical protein R1flu_001387 [Riccia fluitans]|uniref:Uncharacterized protein n=1 Tax=Riccia fluitans TaxID=41844 RepID=A0ABD1Y6D2_9MARC